MRSCRSSSRGCGWVRSAGALQAEPRIAEPKECRFQHGLDGRPAHVPSSRKRVPERDVGGDARHLRHHESVTRSAPDKEIPACDALAPRGRGTSGNTRGMMTIDISVLELDTCNACPRRRLIRAGMNALHRTGDLTDGSAIDYVARVCHGCLAEGSVRAYPSGRWPVAGGRWPVAGVAAGVRRRSGRPAHAGGRWASVGQHLEAEPFRRSSRKIVRTKPLLGLVGS